MCPLKKMKCEPKEHLYQNENCTQKCSFECLIYSTKCINSIQSRFHTPFKNIALSGYVLIMSSICVPNSNCIHIFIISGISLLVFIVWRSIHIVIKNHGFFTIIIRFTYLLTYFFIRKLLLFWLRVHQVLRLSTL